MPSTDTQAYSNIHKHIYCFMKISVTGEHQVMCLSSKNHHLTSRWLVVECVIVCRTHRLLVEFLSQSHMDMLLYWWQLLPVYIALFFPILAKVDHRLVYRELTILLLANCCFVSGRNEKKFNIFKTKLLAFLSILYQFANFLFLLILNILIFI